MTFIPSYSFTADTTLYASSLMAALNSIANLSTVEQSRAMTAEASLSALIGNSSTNTAIENEISRAENAENILNVAIIAEVSRATSAENLLNTAINAEITRATSVENLLNNAIIAEVSRAKTSENSLITAINAEITRAETAESSLAPKNNPSFTGIPVAPTPNPGDNSNRLATTAFCNSYALLTQISNYALTSQVLSGSYHDVTSSRSNGTTYTNSHGKPIVVILNQEVTGNGTSYFYVDGNVAMIFGWHQAGGYNISDTATIFVPSGSTYEYTNGSVNNWVELY